MVVSDNGMELTSQALLRWQEVRSVLWHYVAPGKPPLRANVNETLTPRKFTLEGVR